MESILTSIKKLLGLSEEDTSFDVDITIHINSAFMRLHQLGVGTATAFKITDKTAVWTDFLGERLDLDGVKTYVYFKTRLIFDPPQTSFLLDAIETQIKELEWTLNIQAESISE